MWCTFKMDGAQTLTVSKCTKDQAAMDKECHSNVLRGTRLQFTSPQCVTRRAREDEGFPSLVRCSDRIRHRAFEKKKDSSSAEK